MQHRVAEIFSMKALKALASRGLNVCSRAALQASLLYCHSPPSLRQTPVCLQSSALSPAGRVVCCCSLDEVCHCLECTYVVCVCICIYREWIGVLHLELLAPPSSHFVVPKVRRWLVLYCCSWWTERKRLLPHRSCLVWGSECLIYWLWSCSGLLCCC